MFKQSNSGTEHGAGRCRSGVSSHRFHQVAQFPQNKAPLESLFTALIEPSEGSTPSIPRSIRASYWEPCCFLGRMREREPGTPARSGELSAVSNASRQDPAPSDLGDQNPGHSSTESSLAQDEAPVPGQGGEVPPGPVHRGDSGSSFGVWPRTLGGCGGRSFPGSKNSQLSGLNSIARNRLQRRVCRCPRGSLNYPDIHDDPAKDLP